MKAGRGGSSFPCPRWREVGRFARGPLGRADSGDLVKVSTILKVTSKQTVTMVFFHAEQNASIHL